MWLRTWFSRKRTPDLALPIVWKGDLDDDCTAHWNDLVLRAEWMHGRYWWWAVYDKKGNEIDSANSYARKFTAGKSARGSAEKAARAYCMSQQIKNDPETEVTGMNKLLQTLRQLIEAGPADLETISRILAGYKTNGGQQVDAMAVCNILTDEYAPVNREELADRVLEVKDIVSGWCNEKWRVW